MDDVYFRSIRRLAEYEIWCNARIIEAAESLSAEQLRQPFPLGLQTIHQTVFHLVNVFRTWSGCVGVEIRKPIWLTYDSNATLRSIAVLNHELSAAFLNAIDSAHTAGVLHRDRRIEQVFHLVTHGTHHRTQVITMLRLLGNDPPFEAGDFGGWSNEKAAT